MVESKNLSIISHIPNLSQDKVGIVSVSGESGLGKTTLALQVVSSYLLSGSSSGYQCVWIQASEQFPKKRLMSLFRGFPKKADFLLKNIFVYPPRSPFMEYRKQSDFFRKMGDIMLPIDTKFIVVDNISHHLRLAASLCSDGKGRTSLLDEFFGSQLFPFIMRCLREGIVLILIHEVSFDPGSGRIKPFFDKLYSRINSVNICMSKSFKSGKKQVEITARGRDNGKKIPYKIKDRGIVVL